MPSRSRLWRISLLLVCTALMLAGYQHTQVQAGEEPATPDVHLPIISARLTPVTATPVPDATGEPEPTATYTPTSTATTTPTNTPTRTPEGTPTNTPTLMPGMVLILAGPFEMGCSVEDDPDCKPPEQPRRTITLRSYAMDPMEVSNSRYAACVDATVCTPPHDTRAYSENLVDHYEYYGVPKYADYPVINVDWEQAAAFCAWEGKRLPTEAEWEKAARGSTDARIYPWGNGPLDCTYANYFEDEEGEYCVGETTSIGTYPTAASPYGLLDMSGNVFEWVHDWYDAEYYWDAPADNPQGPLTGTVRVQRGGSHGGYSWSVRAAYRNYFSPTSSNNYIGIRCATSQ